MIDNYFSPKEIFLYKIIFIEKQKKKKLSSSLSICRSVIVYDSQKN